MFKAAAPRLFVFRRGPAGLASRLDERSVAIEAKKSNPASNKYALFCWFSMLRQEQRLKSLAETLEVLVVGKMKANTTAALSP